MSIPLVLDDLLDTVQHARVVVDARYGDIALDLTIRTALANLDVTCLSTERTRARTRTKVE